ncbi:hypothetical protein GCM10028792_28280 [Salinisphaera aquimarina]
MPVARKALRRDRADSIRGSPCTNVEGEWDDVFAAFKRCHEHIHELGAPRVFTTVKLGSRIDRQQSNADKVSSARAKGVDDSNDGRAMMCAASLAVSIRADCDRWASPPLLNYRAVC